jgi:DNA polymerase-3 subunit gamma/tau
MIKSLESKNSPPVPPESGNAASSDVDSGAYRVLARKYRPKTFTDLIGQKVMVRVLSNAISSGRLAHAFILTGVRGVGKTTTARIIARALNCVGPNESGGPTDQPCGQCVHCHAISEDRDVDVIEMDAASRTGVDDIRELIEGVRYKPAAARYKVYIIDEVHMLSKNAFNALLKTLEEPPEHVKFIFATTEIHKIPITVMSRCQRFDLRRVDVETLAAHLTHIAGQENAAITAAAVMLIARAADGSVRDGLSLLDTAISTGSAGSAESPNSKGRVDETQVRAILGLADRTQVFDLLDAVMGGNPAAALTLLEELYASGADPMIVIQDLLVLCHWLTRLKVLPETAEAPEIPEAEAKRGLEMASKLAMPVLTRAWQLLLKGLTEVQTAPAPLVAAEMVLVRLAYSSDLPTPAEIVRDLRKDRGGNARDETGDKIKVKAETETKTPSEGSNGGEETIMTPPQDVSPRVVSSSQAISPQTILAVDEPEPSALSLTPSAPLSSAAPPSSAMLSTRSVLAPDLAPGLAPQEEAPEGTPEHLKHPKQQYIEKVSSFQDVVALAERHRSRLQAHLINDVHLVSFESGRIEFRPGPQAPTKLAGMLSDHLGRWTGARWVVSVSQAEGDPTFADQMRVADEKAYAEAATDPLVHAVLDTFPDATITAVRNVNEPANPEGDDPQ